MGGSGLQIVRTHLSDQSVHLLMVISVIPDYAKMSYVFPRRVMSNDLRLMHSCQLGCARPTLAEAKETHHALVLVSSKSP